MDNKSKTIGFIGLGVMGKPMAKNLVKAGYRLVVYDVKPEPVAEMAALGTGMAASPAEVASRSDIIITMLPNSPHVINVISGENGILDGAGAGKIIIDMSSISPVVSKKMAALAADKGMEMLDAPVSGGEPKAIDGTMSIMVGGKKEVFESVRDLLLTMGGSAVLIGDIGSGNICKLANQIMVAMHLSAVSEAMVFAEKAGVDPEKVYEAIRGGLAGSTVLEARYRSGRKELYTIDASLCETYFAGSRIYAAGNGNTASASEALLGAMISYGTLGYGDIFVTQTAGEDSARTYGKGIMQTTFRNGATGEAIKLTTAEIYWPNSVSIHGKGITAADGAAAVQAVSYGEYGDPELSDIFSRIA